MDRAVAFMSAFFVDTLLHKLESRLFMILRPLWSVKESIIHSVREEVG